jgi:hypothetical protein
MINVTTQKIKVDNKFSLYKNQIKLKFGILAEIQLALNKHFFCQWTLE